MSEDLSRRISEAKEKVRKIQTERDEIIKWADTLSFPLYQLPPANNEALVKQYNKFHYLSGRLMVAQQELSSLLLESMSDVSQQMNQSIGRLNKATVELAKSSGRLEYFSALLLAVAMLAAILPLISPQDPTTRIFLVFVLLAIVIVAVTLIFSNPTKLDRAKKGENPTKT